MLARHLIEREKKKVTVVSADVYRPAAIKQLETLAGEVGAQLTPPRKYLQRDVEELLPLDSPDFAASETLARGGLSAASWRLSRSRPLQQKSGPLRRFASHFENLSQGRRNFVPWLT